MGTYIVVFVLEEVPRLADVSLRDVGKASIDPLTGRIELDSLRDVF